MSYIIIDTSNLFHRARHVVRGNIDEKIGMALSITFHSIKKMWNEFDGHHVVFCAEGRSWRKSAYEPYKRNRVETRAALSPRDAEEDTQFYEAYNDMLLYLTEKTNCTMLHHPQLEADDLIAGFIQSHPNANHVIISTDSDFYQLICDNVSQYNGVSGTHIRHTGFYDIDGNRLVDSKTSQPKDPINPKWMLFEKCMRGDTGDNVFSAYPGVRTKGTKNKVGLLEAYADKDDKGYNWNNLMLSKWTDHNGIDHRVLDDYNRNVMLIDLTAQPTDIREMIDTTIDNIEKKQVPMAGVQFLKFCGKHQLNRLAESATSFGDILSKPYIKEV
jgi:5'-3' exonuclease